LGAEGGAVVCEAKGRRGTTTTNNNHHQEQQQDGERRGDFDVSDVSRELVQMYLLCLFLPFIHLTKP